MKYKMLPSLVALQGQFKKLQVQFEELKAKEEQVRSSELRFRLALEGSNDGIFDWNIRTGEIYLSEHCHAMLGYEPGDLEYTIDSWKKLIHPEDMEYTSKAVNDHFEGKTPSYNNEYRLKTKSGEYKWVLCRGHAVWDENGKPVRKAGSLTDISKRKENEETINKLAYYDSLTGLPNRVLFESKAKAALDSAHRGNWKVAILYLDLDNFKVINDTFGHSFGDVLLKEVGEVLKDCLNENALISRIGGDEFIILLNKVESTQEVLETAECIIGKFSKPWSIDGREFYNTTSIGVAMYPSDGLNIQSLIKNADSAMYKSKDLGKNNYEIFSPIFNQQIAKRLEMETNLSRAIEREEFVVYYQPQIDLNSGKLKGLEALVRWNHPAMGLVSPLEFIPVAEETGAIIFIDQWVMQNACRQIKLWQDMNHAPLFVSVNVSARHFQHKNFKSSIMQILDETGLEARWLDLEIVESTAMKDLNVTITILNELKEMGIMVSLDDFGTGYSSLNYLQKLPISTLKIDKSFVNNIKANSKEKIISESIISLAHKLGLKTIAEGVEKWEQVSFLKEQSCDRAQGYLFSKPLPASEIEEILRSGKRFL